MERAGAVVVAARRTPFASVGRALAGLDAPGLAAPVLAVLAADLAAMAADSGGDARIGIDDVILGNCCGPGGDVARIAALAGGLGVEVPGVSVDRQCGSGLEAIRLAAAVVAAGEADVVLAGGTESASRWSGRRAAFAPAPFSDPEMGEAAEHLAVLRGVSRQRQDAYAARSHARAAAAARSGVFEAELVRLAGMSSDTRPRPGLDAATLARFRPAFTAAGSVTAGNSCGINDGAAAVAVVSEAWRARARVPGLRVLAAAVAGVDPATPGLGPVPAVEAVLKRAGLGLADVGVVEIVEAFAAQVLACTDALGLDALGGDAGRVCPEGGALAVGHPWGASGAFSVMRLFSSLVRRPDGADSAWGEHASPYGIATCAIGGGQGIAVLVERVGPSMPPILSGSASPSRPAG